MPEAVIVDAVRTPVGRAFKGSLASLRPDETTAFIIDQLLERNPEVDPSSVEEVIAGCGLPQGLQANNIGRISVLLSDKLGRWGIIAAGWTIYAGVYAGFALLPRSQAWGRAADRCLTQRRRPR